MRTVSFFHKETGMFNGNHMIVSDDSVLALNTPPDHIVIDGHHDPLSKRVDLAAPPELVDDINQYGVIMGKRIVHKVVDYVPPQPSVDHEWNAATKRWALNAATVAKAQRGATAASRIAQLVEGQHHWTRRHILGDKTALEQLREIDDLIAVLSADL